MDVRVDAFGPPGLTRAFTTVTVRGPAPGRRVAMTANLHGDECTGIGVVHALLPILEGELKSGTVRLYPSLNPEGLKARSRLVPADKVDMNRVFPGDPRGSDSERAAHAIWKDILAFRPDLVVDLHADSLLSIPYVILDRPVTHRQAWRADRLQRLKALGDASGLTVLWDFPDAEYRRFRLDRSLTGALLNHADVLALTVEVGPRLLLSPRAVEAGLAAACGILTEAGLLDRPAVPHGSRIPGGPWRRDGGPRCSRSGVLFPLAAPGTWLERNAPLAEVRDMAGSRLDLLVAQEPCFVVSVAERAHVTRSASVATVGVRDG